MNAPNKTERFEMRIDQGVLDAVDGWRSKQEDVPSRAEAMRRLIDAGIASQGGNEIKLGDGDKLSLLMLCDIHEHLKIKDGMNYEFIRSVIYGGHYWALDWKYTGVFHGHIDDKKSVTEVVDALDMWFFIESGYSKLSKRERERVEIEAEPFGKYVTFSGYDGNYEGKQYSIARFLIDDMDRFQHFKGRELNSHVPSVETYRRMFRLFEPMRATLIGQELNASQIIELMKARRGPR